MSNRRALIKETRCSISCWCKVLQYDIYTDSYLVIPEDLTALKDEYLKEDFSEPIFIVDAEHIITFSESD